MDLSTFNKRIIPIRHRLLMRSRQLLGNDSDAEDIVQETMLKLWSMRDQLDSHPNQDALAMTILRNKAHDLWRRKHETADLPQDRGSESNIAEARSDMELIDMIIEHLPPLQRDVFRLKEIEGCEAEEIIAITGCSYEALRQNLSRARRKIREEFIRLSNYKKI
ncbi:MAG: RNA polymerase sigma factor [Bacteroidales bacterium]|nr:RNA polymerase sigma factor [Bacteroidales bacterium]MCM1148421.1 RNA polymerase sigma factor [Bacteroidales bacterium]MCM1207275.1 RNA polymerase sigma factor [Bacillota bacterium]MCM1511498.1 RNA polymerase sigma factor [Clostridium sp.]